MDEHEESTLTDETDLLDKGYNDADAEILQKSFSGLPLMIIKMHTLVFQMDLTVMTGRSERNLLLAWALSAAV